MRICYNWFVNQIVWQGGIDWQYEATGSVGIFKDAADIATPYRDAVTWAVEKGITTGYNDGSFRPNDTCTRWAVVLFMYRDME